MKTDCSFRAQVLLLGATLLVLGSVSCKEASNTSTTPKGHTLVGAGSTFTSVLFKHWFEEYQKQHSDIVINYSPVGSGEGVRRFIDKGVNPDESVDFGASDAALQDNEIGKVDGGALMLPITAGGVVLAYNLPDFKGELRLSREAYVGIFLGEIRQWNDNRIAASNPGVKLPALEITPIIRSDSSGTTFAFTNNLDALSPEWHTKHGVSKLLTSPEYAMRAPGNEGVASRIQQAVGSIGYIEFQFSRQLDLKIATLENKQGNYIQPTEEAFVDGLSSAEFPENLRVFVPDPSGTKSYPIVTYSWALVRRRNADLAKAKALQDLFTWCLTDGQNMSSKFGYVPLPSAVSDKSLAALRTINVQ